MEGLTDTSQHSLTMLEMLKAIRVRAQELREQTMARYEQLVIDREVRESERLLSRCADSFTVAPARSHPLGYCGEGLWSPH